MYNSVREIVWNIQFDLMLHFYPPVSYPRVICALIFGILHQLVRKHSCQPLILMALKFVHI